MMARTHQATGETLLVPSTVEANGHSGDVAAASNITKHTVSQFMNEWQRRRNAGERSRKVIFPNPGRMLLEET